MLRNAERVRSALSSIENPGSFAVRREAPSSDLRLEVKGVGTISFPVSPTKARALCSAALLAQYGFRDQTRLDRTVRDTWEIPKGRIKIDQARWNRTLVPELDRIRKELGLGSQCELRAELHNLLVYAPGQFFVPHQDSEKEDDMIGTLVVTLPSAFSGGSIVIKHHDEKVEHRGAGRNLGLVAFYADCHHEIRPVQTGYRIVLTYNLLLSRAGEQRTSAAESQLDELGKSVHEFLNASRPTSWGGNEPESPPDRLVYLLDHQYSRKGLSWSRLKNGDAARGAALRDAATRLGCDIGLALVDVHETWSCEEEEYGHGSSWRHRGDEDADAGDSPDNESGEPELLELQISEVELRHFVDSQGKPGAAAGYVPDAELCYTKPSMHLDPFRSEHEGYMGNWGNTVDRWYHRAAVVMWPRERTFVIRAKTSATFALDGLADSIRGEGLTVAQRKAEQLVPFWPRVWHEANDSRLVKKALRIALGLSSPALALGIAKPLRLEHLNPKVVPVVVELVEAYESPWIDQVLEAWESHGVSHDDTQRLAWLEAIDKLVAALVDHGSAPARRLAERLVREQEAWLTTRSAEAFKLPPSLVLKRLMKLEKAQLALMRSSVCATGRPLEMLLGFLISPDYPVLALAHLLETAWGTCDAPTFTSLGLDKPAVHCISELETSLARPARAPDDWTIAAPTRCSCALCTELRRFLAARNRTNLEWPLAKDGRAHVHRILDGYELPVTHVTRRSGRPYVLVLTKTRDLFDREAAERAAWQRSLDALVARNGTFRNGRVPSGAKRKTKTDDRRNQRRRGTSPRIERAPTKA